MTLLAALLALLLVPQTVERVEISTREPLREGSAYERIEGILHFAFDPEAAENAAIVDLALAPRDADGRVRCRADLYVLQPVDAASRSGTVLLEVSNRGGRASVNYFGEDFLASRGVTVVWVGWQADVPVGAGLRLDAPTARNADGSPITGLVRCDWTVDALAETLGLGHRGHIPYSVVDEADPLNRLTLRDGRLAPRREMPRADWAFSGDGLSISSDGGFEAGHLYELVYRAQDPTVIGLGLAVVRETIAFAKSGDARCPFPGERGVAVGISQTGRFLRHFLWQGFNRTADGSAAFDGMLIHTAGAGRGSFNHRFAQPSRDAHRYSAFFYPTDLFPFSGRTQRDPESGARDGVYARALESFTMPKVFLTNTGYEYWGRAAALTHVSCDGAADLEALPEERIYHLRGAQHYPGGWPPRGDNPIDLRSIERAMLANLLDWVENGVEPPPSSIPRIDDGTLVPLSEYAWSESLGARPRAAQEAYRCDYGPRWAEGIVGLEPPVLGKPFPVLVPQVNAMGNEIAGSPNLETMVPLGVWVPWSLRADGELNDFTGRFLPYSYEKRSELYPAGRAAYLKRAGQVADLLVLSRHLLGRDRQAALERAAALWDWVVERN